MKLKLVIILFSYPLLLACTRGSSPTSTVRLQFPNYNVLQTKNNKGIPAALALPVVQRNGSWGQADPTSLDGIGCFAVFVGGPTFNGSSCKQTDGTILFNFGPAAGLFSPDQTISLTLASGSAATIYVAGLGLAAGASCEPNVMGGAMNSSLYSEPFLLGQATTTLVPGDQTVDVHIGLDATTPRFTDCNFPNSTGGGSGPAAKVALLNSNFLSSPVIGFQSGTSPSQGTCIPIFAQVQDASGNSASPPSNTTLTVTDSTAGGHFFSDAGCTNTVTFPTSLAWNTLVLYYESQTASPAVDFATTLTATSNTLSSGSALSVQMLSGTYATGTTNAVPVIPNSSIQPWQCSPIFFVGHSSASATSSVAPFASYMFSPPATTNVSYFKDSGCVNPITSSSYLMAPTASASIFFQYSGTANSVTIGSGGTSVSIPVSGTAQPPMQLTLQSPAATTAGQCPAMTVSLLNSSGGPTGNITGSAIPVQLTGPAGTFYLDSGCSTSPLSSGIGSISAGTSGLQFYFKPSAAATGTIAASATLGGQSVTTTSPITVAGAPPSYIFVRMPGQTFNLGSGLTPTTPPLALFWGGNNSAEIILTDASYNPLPWSGTVSITYANGNSPGPGSLTFNTTDNGRKTISLSYLAATYGSPSYITESLSVSAGSVFGNSQNFYVEGLSDSYFGVVGYMANGATSCSPFVVYVADINKDVKPAASAWNFTFTASTGVTVWSDPACSSSSVSAGSNLTVPSGAVTSPLYYMKTTTSSSDSLTITSAQLISPTGTSTYVFSKNAANSTGQYTAGNQYYDISVQTPASTAQGRCFPILVDATSDLGNLEFPVSSPSSFAFANLPASCPTIYDEGTCTTPATVSDTQMTTSTAAVLLYTKAVTSSPSCTLSVNSYAGATNAISPLPNHQTVNSPAIH